MTEWDIRLTSPSWFTDARTSYRITSLCVTLKKTRKLWKSNQNHNRKSRVLSIRCFPQQLKMQQDQMTILPKNSNVHCAMSTKKSFRKCNFIMTHHAHPVGWLVDLVSHNLLKGLEVTLSCFHRRPCFNSTLGTWNLFVFNVSWVGKVGDISDWRIDG